MAWSTRELAQLSGTTVNTIRHYHRLGLLQEPVREENGYKQYGVSHLVRLLRIRRLADLGVPLAQIGAVEAGGEPTLAALRDLDTELAASIERLERARADIATILRERAPADVPAGFEAVATRLSPSDTSMIHIYSRLYDEEALADVRALVDQYPEEIDRELEELREDADEATRADLAERLAPHLARSLRDYPWLRDPAGRLQKSPLATAETFVKAVVELYRPAQLDVLHRASNIAHRILAAADIAGEERAPGASETPHAPSA